MGNNANISPSKATTSSGNQVYAKIQKLRANMLFLLMADAPTRLIVLSEKDIYERCLVEVKHGRVPLEIQFVHVKIPETLKAKLLESQKIAADEVSPKGVKSKEN